MLTGAYYYRVTAVDQACNESTASDPVEIVWPPADVSR
jgi:hypothetical protein